MLDFGLKFEYVELEDSVYYMKIFWSVNVVCVKDFNRSVIVNFWDVVGKSVFCYSQDEMIMNIILELNEVFFYLFNNYKCLSYFILYFFYKLFQWYWMFRYFDFNVFICVI